ncbi:MAG: class I SAM-dependent methyltransferase family protein [Phycisphaerae bacterium]|nr:class I SAM-dependent methyltransferase family protein [Phycisphaerae bacterium]
MNTDGLTQLDYERIGPVGKVFKKAVTDPLVNFVLPSGFIRWVLRITKSEMAEASWSDPGGWKSMVLSYRDDMPPQIADRFLIKLGSMPIALRNRRKLCVEIMSRMIRDRAGQRTNIVCLGAGPGMIVLDAMDRSEHKDCHAYLMDLNPDSFEFGRDLAKSKELDARVQFIHGNVKDYRTLCPAQPHIVKMIGILEYLPDAIVSDIVKAISEVMPPGGQLIANSLTRRHGTDRFFRRVFDLHMIHRSADCVRKLLADSGIATDHVFTEPLGVYDVLVCRKN